MRNLLLSSAAVLLLAPPAAAQDFRWHGTIPQGQTIEIKGVNGDVRAEPSGSNEVEVVAEKHARRDNPESVQIQVVPHAGGVTICAVSVTRRRGPTVPARRRRRMNMQAQRRHGRFTVRVPAGVRDRQGRQREVEEPRG